MKGGDYFRRAIVEYLIGMALGAAFTVAACATLADPPSNWPTAPSCAQSPNSPGCAGDDGDNWQPIDINARRAVDAGYAPR